MDKSSYLKSHGPFQHLVCTPVLFHLCDSESIRHCLLVFLGGSLAIHSLNQVDRAVGGIVPSGINMLGAVQTVGGFSRGNILIYNLNTSGTQPVLSLVNVQQAPYIDLIPVASGGAVTLTAQGSTLGPIGSLHYSVTKGMQLIHATNSQFTSTTVDGYGFVDGCSFTGTTTLDSAAPLAGVLPSGIYNSNISGTVAGPTNCLWADSVTNYFLHFNATGSSGGASVRAIERPTVAAPAALPWPP